MSEQLIRFLLPELATVVIRCLRKSPSACTGAIEIGAGDLKSLKKQLACPVCGAVFTYKMPGHSLSPLEELGQALEDLKTQGQGDNFQIEFVVPQPTK